MKKTGASKLFSVLPCGDSAVSAEFDNTISEQVNQQVHQLAKWLEQKRIRGITELVPTYRSLLIHYDPARLRYAKLVRILSRFTVTASDTVQTRTILRVPCLYDGEDLASMEVLTGLTKEEIISIHAGTDYKIYMLGFLPGFVYLGGLDQRLHAPRLPSPRTKIPAGSVGIGGTQTGIYPMASPGGWRLIGRTPLPLYDPARENPVLCKAGEFIRFEPIDLEAFQTLEAQAKAGTLQPDYVETVGKP